MTGRGRGDERGAILVLASITISLLVLMAAFAVDIGHTAMTKRQMHTVADIAAQDALNGLGNAQGVLAAVKTLAIDSATRNGLPTPSDPTIMQVHIGVWDASQGTFTQIADNASNAVQLTANAVEVTVKEIVNHTFIGGAHPVYGTAIAILQGDTGLQIGTFAARAQIGTLGAAFLDGLLCGQLGCGTPLSVTALSYQGLAQSSVTLGDLAAQLGAASATSVLDANTSYSDKQILSAAATVLNNHGQSAAAATMAGIAAGLSNTTTSGNSASLGQIFNVSTTAGNGAVLANGASINAFDLLMGSTQAALINGQNAVSFSVSNLGVPGVLSIDAQTGVIEAPDRRFGPACPAGTTSAPPPGLCASASSAQLRTNLTLHLTPVNILGSSVAVTLPLYLTSAGGDTWVTQIVCHKPSDGQADVAASAATSIAYAAIGTAAAGNLTQPTSGTVSGGGTTQVGNINVQGGVIVNATIPTVLGPTTLTMTDTAVVSVPGSSGTNTFSGPCKATGPSTPAAGDRGVAPTDPQPNQQPWTLAAGTLGGVPVPPLGQQLATAYAKTAPTVTLTVDGQTYVGLGNAATALINAGMTVGTAAVNSEVSATLSSLDSAVLQPLANVLQVGLGGADIFNAGEHPPAPPDGTNCTNPILVK